MTLVEASSVSPIACQYLPSLGVVFESLATSVRVGDVVADEALLPQLIRAAREDYPSVVGEEDYLPHDPRLDVRVEWAGEMFRIAAGRLERPTSDVDMLRRLGLVIDPVLRVHARYALTDLVELVLRRVDAVVVALAGVWDADVAPELGDTPALSREEFAAATSVPPLEHQIAQCSDPERARAALEAHAVPRNRFRRNGASMVAAFGSAIAVRHGRRGFTPLPAGLLVESLNALAIELTDKALALDPSLDRKWQQAASDFVGHLFAGAGNEIIGPLRDERRPHLHSVIRYSDSQYLTISVAAGLDHQKMQRTINTAARQLEEVLPGSSIKTTGGVVTVPSSAKLCRLIIVAQPLATMIGAPDGARCAAITLQDLDWIRRTIGRAEIDLWYFVRDRIEQSRIGQLLSWDGIDLWEVWRSNGKSFYRGARQVDVLYVQPHQSRYEWRKVSEQREIEMALHFLGLGHVTDWPLHDLDSDSKTIGNVLTGKLYRLVLSKTPVAVSLRPLSRGESYSELAANIGECIAYKLKYTESQFTSLMLAADLQSLRIEFEFGDNAQDTPLRIESFENGVLILGCASHLMELLKEDSRSVEKQFGRLLADALGGEARGADEFATAWHDAPPGIRLDFMTVGPKLQQSPEATPLHEAHRSARLAELGAHLKESQVEPGEYGGGDAKRLETGVIYPWLIARLRDQLSAFDHTALLELAITQLEYANCHRWWQIERTRFEVGSPTDEADHQAEVSQDLLRRSRSIGMMIEEILALEPTGTERVNAYEWQELLSLATIASESGYRSEALHLGLADTTLVISNSYEVTITDSDLSTSIDFESYARDRRLSALPDPVPIGEAETPTSPDEGWTPLGERAPDFAAIDAALQASLGFGLDAILGVLDAVIQWPVALPRCTEFVPLEKVAADSHDANPVNPRACYAEAAAWLSVGMEDFDPSAMLIEHWEIEPRAARIATRPLAREGSSVWVAPWTAEIARRTWVNYISEHRLPIPDCDLPTSVGTALADARQKRQRNFERECRTRLNGLPLTSVGRIRETSASVHGIAHLTGEIDDLLIDGRRSVVFVIEAKDPFVALSARTVNRQISRFHGRNGFVSKLQQKVEDIKASAASLAENKGIERPERDWQVVGVMVTRHVTPAAYVRDCPSVFCTIDSLRHTIEDFGS